MRLSSNRLGLWLGVVLTATLAQTSAGQPSNACCDNDGNCHVLTLQACELIGGIPAGGCITCDVLPCTVACCAIDGACVVAAANACPPGTVTNLGMNSTCLPEAGCPLAVGPCCLIDGTCTMVTQIDCIGVGGLNGTFQGTGITCVATCPPPRGACCRGGQCTFAFQSECMPFFWSGPGTSCQAFLNPCCPAEFNDSGVLSVQDIFDFLAAYFAGSSSADFNRSCSRSVQDIFDFLAAYFAGCPS